MGEALDKFIADSRRTFMDMSELPTVEVDEEGREISSFSNTYEASHQVLATMPIDEKLALLRELFEEEVIIVFDSSAVDSGQRTMREVLDDCLVYGLGGLITSDPEVNAREQSNMETHDIGFGPAQS